MIFKDEEMAKRMVAEIMSSEWIDIVPGKGLIFNTNIVWDRRFLHITQHPEYLAIEQKVSSIISLINRDPALIDRDLESELWYLDNN